MIVVSHDGENSIVVTSAANQKLTPHDLETHMQMIREAGLVLTKLETPVETVECLAHLRPRECAADPRSCPGERASSRRLQSPGLGHSEPGGSSILYQRSSRERRNAEPGCSRARDAEQRQPWRGAQDGGEGRIRRLSMALPRRYPPSPSTWWRRPLPECVQWRRCNGAYVRQDADRERQFCRRRGRALGHAQRRAILHA